MKVNISAVIITYNEEQNIERCILSVKDVVDEILIVDSYSKDRTKEIALQYDVRFLEHAFEGHIQQKNYAKSQAKYDYVLSLDADECLSDTLKEAILKVKDNWESDGYKFNRCTNYAGKWIKHSGWYPDTKLRLWEKDKGDWTGRNPHDRLDLKEGYKVSHLKGDLLHYSIRDVQHHLDIIKNFTTISAEAMFEEGKKLAFIHMLINPFWKFMKNFFIKGGFLDGKYGFFVCFFSAYATYLKYFKLMKLNWAK
jgi:glycosyltransferase involved in cell wall biosynthesis